jgi:ferric-dicitrate binding protein FerR (iron transport regulator)
MSTTFDARDGDAPTPASPNVALADEESLRRVFLSEYSALTEEARADLGTEARALAPKVVEGSFVRAWDARSRFRTPEEVHQFLVEDVHHAAARALSRRASAHRLSGGGHADAHTVQDESPEEAWSHIMHALHGEAHSPQALANAAAHSRHEAAEHIKVSSKGTPIWIPLLIGAVVLAVLLGLATYMTHLSTNERFARALNAPDAKPIAAASAQIGVVTLDDGSKVRLTPESRIIVPKLFGPELRVVRLEGTAEFTVAPGVPNPFTVNAKNLNVVATGTTFTVRAGPGDTAVTVVVTEGAVQVGQRKDMHDVAAGSAVVAEGSDVRVRPATAIERDEADAWRSGMLVVNDKPLGQVLPMFKRWYGLAVLVPQPALLERRVTFRASLDSTRQAIRGIEESTGLQFGYIGQNMAFHEPEAKPAAKPAAKGAKGKKK